MKQHYYLFNIVGVGRISGSWNTVFSFNKNYISKQAMDDAVQQVSEHTGATSKSLIISSISYLGYMTKEEFNG